MGVNVGLTLAQLTQAIKSKVDLDMETTVAESIAEHALGFFGFSNRIIDNALEPTDRNLFYQLQDYDLLTTESEETTLWDGREWRIHYWKFKSNADKIVAEAEAERKRRALEEDPYAQIYDGMPADLWRERSGVDDDYEEPLF
ncbi:MAG: hypothetical protein CL993_00935 [Euryarchaeota archaeon]|nr:hypothetical protein [Euryarchaeota archaeon]